MTLIINSQYEDLKTWHEFLLLGISSLFHHHHHHPCFLEFSPLIIEKPLLLSLLNYLLFVS